MSPYPISYVDIAMLHSRTSVETILVFSIRHTTKVRLQYLNISHSQQIIAYCTFLPTAAPHEGDVAQENPSREYISY